MQAKDSIPFDPQALRSLLDSPAGKALLQHLQQDGGAALRQAAEAVRNGDTERAQQIMAPLMQTPEATRLTALLNQAERRRHGRT